jgi:hypothetical protein
LKPLLSGGDRRSIARSNRAGEHVNEDPAKIEELAALTADTDWLVSMRALDLLEKLAHESPERVQRHKKLFIGPLAESDKWEIRLQIVRALPLLRWTARERPRVIEILRSNVDYQQTFVRAWALDSLATFAKDDPVLLRTVRRLLVEFERSDSKALQARARQIRSRLEAVS